MRVVSLDSSRRSLMPSSFFSAGPRCLHQFGGFTWYVTSCDHYMDLPVDSVS